MVKPESPELILEAGRASRHYWADLWRYRELLGFLAWRDIKVRYKQTVLGVLWALLQPLLTMGIFSFIFGTLARMGQDDARYPLVVMAGLLPWQLFSAGLSGSSNSLVANSHLISKVYFPRLIVPLSSLAVALVDFLVAMGLYLLMALYFGESLTWRCLMLPAFILCALLIAIGAGLWLTALTVKYRDFRYVVPFLLQLGLFLSPIGFRTDVLPNWRDLLALNPLTGVIEGFRWCLLSDAPPLYVHGQMISFTLMALLFGSGLWFFRKTERQFADVI